MQVAENKIFYDLPSQSKTTEKGFELQPEAIDDWYAELHLANTLESIQHILTALKEVNNRQVSFKKRLYFLEKIHDSVIQNAASLNKMNLNRSLPLDKNQQPVADLVQNIHIQMAIGYKAVLYDIINCKLGVFCLGGKKLQPLAIQRIIRHISFVLLYCYQFYSIPPKGLWSNLHQLFLLAESKKLSHKKVTDPSYQLVAAATIKDAYLQILLLAIADPYRMTQLHIGAVFNQLEQWAQLANIIHFAQADKKDSLRIDLDTDTNPGLRQADDVPESHTSWLLDTSKLKATDLLHHLEEHEKQPTEIDSALFRQLSLTWGIPATRQHTRQAAQATMKVAIGLNDTHFVLNGFSEPAWLEDAAISDHKIRSSTDNSAGKTAHFNSHLIKSSIKRGDIWGKIFQDSLNKSDEKFSRFNTDREAGKVTKSSERIIRDWELVNESEGGYCLLWDQNEVISIKVGEIIALRLEDSPDNTYWTVGSVRWIQCLRNHAVQIGIQILASNAVAVSINKFTRMHTSLKRRAILLPAISALNQPETLITTALGYSAGDDIKIEEEKENSKKLSSISSKITLLDVLERSSHYCRFKFSHLEHNKSSQQVKTTQTHEKADSSQVDAT